MTVFIGLIVGNLIMLAIGLLGARWFAHVARVPRRLLGPIVMILIMIGTYAYQNYGAHVAMALILGAIAYYFERLNIPPVPIVLAFVMGPIIEHNLERGLIIHSGDMTFLMDRPITVIILAMALATAVFGILRGRKDGKAKPD